MRYEAERREVHAHLDKQASALRAWRWGAILVLVAAAAGLYAGVGTPALLAFVVAVVYWRDTRSREQSLENARLTFNMQHSFANALGDLTDRLDKISPPEPRPNIVKSFMERVERRAAAGGG